MRYHDWGWFHFRTHLYIYFWFCFLVLIIQVLGALTDKLFCRMIIFLINAVYFWWLWTKTLSKESFCVCIECLQVSPFFLSFPRLKLTTVPTLALSLSSTTSCVICIMITTMMIFPMWRNAQEKSSMNDQNVRRINEAFYWFFQLARNWNMEREIQIVRMKLLKIKNIWLIISNTQTR